MRVGLFASPRLSQTAAFSQALALAGAEVVVLDTDLPVGTDVVLEHGEIWWNGAALSGLDAVFVHGFQYQDPVLPPAEPVVDWSFWQSGHVVAQQSYSFLYSVLCRLGALPIRLYNPVDAYVSAFAHFSDLGRWADAGIAVPDILCTNEPDVADAACRGWGRAVWHPATGRGAWQLFRERQRRDLVGPDKPPVLLAEAVDGPLVRAYLFQGAVLAAVCASSPDGTGLERLEIIQTAFADDPGLLRIARLLTERGVPWAGVQCVMTANGPVLYDLDPDPMLMDLPRPLAALVLDRLAAMVVGGTVCPLPAAAAYERTALFQRRMLRVQFEMERTKHLP